MTPQPNQAGCFLSSRYAMLLGICKSSWKYFMQLVEIQDIKEFFCVVKYLKTKTTVHGTGESFAKHFRHTLVTAENM